MIATILPGSTNFHAVGYNERKVSKGVARLLEIQNFGTLGTFGKATPDELVKYLTEYSSRNDRILKAQFHVALSCKGHEMSEAELLEFTHQYLREMGYHEPGQPLLIYSHYDTDNTHLHVVTSRIAPDGRKIAHDHERRRSQEVIDHILGNNRKEKTAKDIDDAKAYTFSSFAQFKAILTAMGYEAYQKNDKVYIKYGGKVQQELSLSEIESLFKSNYRDRARCRQLRSILKKYRDVSTDKEELQKELKSKFGIDLVFFGKKDTPYGYMIIDHANQTVIHGARVLTMDELLDFATPEQRFDRIEDYIDQLLTLNPKITQGEIYKKLRKQRAYIKKGVIYSYDGKSRPLKPFMAEAIDRNNRIERVEQFHPTTEAERDMLCQIFKVNRPDLISLSEEKSQALADAVQRIRTIFEDTTNYNVRSSLREQGFILRQEADTTFAIDFKNHVIINLNEKGLDLSRLQWKDKPQNTQKNLPKHLHNTTNIRKFRDAGGGSQSEKREWEVGHKGNYDEIDDVRTLKR